MATAAAGSRNEERSGLVKHRARASLACDSCRQRKVKCDVLSVDPAPCTSCRGLRIACVVSRDGDRRRFGTRQHIASLQDRIQSLETMLNSANAQLSTRAHTGIDESLTVSLQGPGHPLDRDKPPDAALAVSPADHQPSRQWQADVSVGDGPGMAAEGNAGSMPPDLTPPGLLQRPTPTISNLARRDDNVRAGESAPYYRANADTAPPSSIPSVPDQNQRQSAVDTLPEDDEVDSNSFFGPTSQLHFTASSMPHQEQGDASTTPRFTIDPDSASLKRILFQYYWDFQPLSSVIVNETTFMAHQSRGKRTQYYSKFLESALLSCSARLSTSPAVRALKTEYAKRAKLDIVSELDNATVASVQGFLMLSDYEMSEGRHRTGWNYCGIACRMVFDLGLHQDIEKTVDASPSDHEFRRILFFGCALYEKLYSIYLGRPSCISTNFLSWPSNLHGVYATSTLQAWVGLCRLMGEMTDILNTFPLDTKSTERLSDLDGNLIAWYESLPPDIVWTGSNTTDLDATVYGLHMQACRVQMILHRIPRVFTSRSRKFASPDEDFLIFRGWTPERSRQHVYRNAVRIAELLLAYRQTFGVEHIPTVMMDNIYVAATILLSQVLKQPSSHSVTTDLKWLRFIFDTLEALKVHFPIMERMLRTLTRVVEGTHLSCILDVRDNSSQSTIQIDGREGDIQSSRGGDILMDEYLGDSGLYSFIDPGDGIDGSWMFNFDSSAGM